MKNKKFAVQIACIGLALLLGLAFWVTLIDAIRSVSVSYSGGASASMNEDTLAKRIAEEFAKSQNSIIESHTETALAPDPADMTFAFTVTVVPYAFSDGTTATLTVNGESAQLQSSGGAFSGSVRLPFTAAIPEYRVTLRENGQTKNETISLLLFSMAEVPPYLERGQNDQPLFFNGKAVWSFSLPEANDGPSYSLKGATVALNPAALPFGEKAATSRVFALRNDKEEIFTAELNNNRAAPVQELKRSDGDVIDFYGEVTGTSGMVYRYWLGYAESSIVSYYNEEESTVNLLGENGQSLRLQTKQF